MIRGKQTIGIIGGMGPLATVDLFLKIIQNTVAESDQEHMHVLIDNNTGIPDRTRSILEGSNEPLVFMAESANRLAAQGADLLIIPCNTAHHYYPGVAESVSIPVLNMPAITARYCADHGYTRIGLLATEGTYRTKIYDPYFAERGIEVLLPSPDGVQKLMYLIYDEVKAGKPVHPGYIHPELDALKEQGAQAFILACTELPLVFSDPYADIPFIDPTLLLAREAVREAGGRVTPA